MSIYFYDSNNTTLVDDKTFEILVRTSKKNIYTKYIFAFIMLIIGVIILVFGIMLKVILYIKLLKQHIITRI